MRAKFFISLLPTSLICDSLFDFSLGRECPILYSGVAKHNSDVKNVKGNQDYALVPEHLKRAYKQVMLKIYLFTSIKKL